MVDLQAADARLARRFLPGERTAITSPSGTHERDSSSREILNGAIKPHVE